MRINQKVRYGVACLYELSKNPQGYTDANLVAHRQEIPTAYAQKVLQLLAQAGLVIGLKGSGYRLASPLETITVLKVMEALSADQSGVEHEGEIGIVIEQRVREALDTISLACLSNK